MKKKSKKCSAVYAGQSGSVSVKVYLRSQIKSGTEYISYTVVDYTSGIRKFLAFSEFEDAKKKANDILMTKIRPRFYEHRRATDVIVEKVREKKDLEAQQAAEDAGYWTQVMTVVSVVMVVGMGVGR